MHGFTLSSLIPLAGLLINILIQIISYRFFKKFGLLRTIFAGFLVGILYVFTSFFIFCYRDNENFIYLLISNLLTYSCLGYCYFHFINLGETARRIRILTELYNSKKGLTKQEILEHYDAPEILGRRISRLVNSGQIIYLEQKYYIGNPLMLLIAKSILLMKLLLLGKKTNSINEHC